VQILYYYLVALYGAHLPVEAACDIAGAARMLAEIVSQPNARTYS